MIVLPLVIGSALAVPHPNSATTGAVAQETDPTSTLPSTVDGEERVKDGVWHGTLDIGLSKTEGNADIETFALSGRITRDYDVHRYTGEALWYYATTEDVRTQRRALGAAKYDQFIFDKTYVYANAFAETNEQAFVDLRWAIGAGVGQQWRDDEQWRINTELGLAWFDEDFDNGDQVDYLAVRAAWSIFTQITPQLAFGHDAEIYPSLDDKDDIYGRATTYLETSISESMVAKLSWIIAYDNTPTVDEFGQRLERVDNLYLLTVGWVF